MNFGPSDPTGLPFTRPISGTRGLLAYHPSVPISPLERRELMRSKPVRASLCVGVALLGILFVGCDREYREIVVVDGDQAEVVTWGRAPKKPRDIWSSGRTLVFRTDGEVPGIPKKASGKAGRVY